MSDGGNAPLFRSMDQVLQQSHTKGPQRTTEGFFISPRNLHEKAKSNERERRQNRPAD